MKTLCQMFTKARFLFLNGVLVISFLLAACGPSSRRPGSTLSESPAYMIALSKALEVCDHVGIDQICFGQGTITVESQPNVRLEDFTQPGDILALEAIAGLQLESSDDWSVAVMRLQADFTDAEKYLTVVVMGETQLSNINVSLDDLPPLVISSGEDDMTQTTPAMAPAILEPLQSFNFSSEPLSDDPTDSPNGLLMWTPLGDEAASILLNGAVITLGSTALVHTPSSDQMTVAMLEGTTLVTAADGGTGIAEGGTQVSVPIVLTGEIRDPRAEAVVHVVAQYQPEPLKAPAEAFAHTVAQYAPKPLNPRAEAIVHAVNQYVILNDPRAEAIAYATDQYPHEVAKDIKARYQRAINRCTDLENPQPRYVYNVLYFYNLIRAFEDPDILEAFLAAGLSNLDAQISRCLSFELDFDSTIYVDDTVTQSTSHVRAEGVKLQFSPNGEVESEPYPLQYLSFDIKTLSEDACPVDRFETVDGTFQVTGGGLKVNGNRLSLTIEIANQNITENLVTVCPTEEIPVPNFIRWRTYFAVMHGSQQLEIDHFAIPDWKFTGNGEHFAEAIYESNFSMGSSQIDETTFLVLVHTPQR